MHLLAPRDSSNSSAVSRMGLSICITPAAKFWPSIASSTVASEMKIGMAEEKGEADVTSRLARAPRREQRA